MEQRTTLDCNTFFACPPPPNSPTPSGMSRISRRLSSNIANLLSPKRKRERRNLRYLDEESLSALSENELGSAHSSGDKNEIRSPSSRGSERRRRHSWSSSTSFSGLGFLTKEELHELPTKELRRRCRRLGVDVRKAVDNSDFVQALHDHYCSSAEKRELHGSVSEEEMPQRGSGRKPEIKNRRRAQNVDESETSQMVDILHELMPFFGQGDKQSDFIVRDTIKKLPPIALEMRDDVGNTTLLLACQSGAYDLVPMLISRGCDVNAQNNDGVASLHFTCYTDSFSSKTANLLVQNEAKAEVAEKQYGCTPLHWAAFAGDKRLCSLLCRAGANPKRTDRNDCDAITYARQSGNEACVDFLVALSDKAVVGEPPPSNSITTGEWEQLVEIETGRIYFHNAASNHSLWEEDYEAFLRSDLDNPVTTEDDSSSSIENDNYNSGEKRTAPTSLSSATDTPPKLVPQTNATSGKECRGMSDTFETRFISLQAKMEKQFMEKLSKIEGRITEQQQQASSRNEQKGGIWTTTNDSVIEMTSKLAELQSNVGSKDLEIISLKREMLSLETKLAGANERSKRFVQTRDASVGATHAEATIASSPDATRQLKIALAAKTSQLEQIQQQSLDLIANLKRTEQSLSAAQAKQAAADQEAIESQELIAEERLAKERLVRLLEERNKGAGNTIESTRKDDITMRDEEAIARLESDLNNLRKMKTQELTDIKRQLEEKDKKLEEESVKAASLAEEREEMVRSLATEKQKQSTLQCVHIKEMQSLIDSHARETSTIRDELTTKYGEDQKRVNQELNEERLSRMEKEVERNDAIEAKESAIKRSIVAENKLKEVSELVEEAKALVGVNDRLHRSLQTEAQKRKILHNKLEDIKGRIRVYVRIRPLSISERERQCQTTLVKEDRRTCVMEANLEKGKETKSWEFDHIFCGSEQGNGQKDIFKDTRLLVTSAVDGFNVCIFAYGQTGSGKTYTMFGPGALGHELVPDGTLKEESGLASRVADELFRVINEKEASSHLQVEVSMFELYNNSLRDLLATSTDGLDPSLTIKLATHSDTGMVEVIGATKETVKETKELLSLFARGSAFRTTATTDMNADSSRSHLMAQMVTTVTNKRTGKQIRGKLTLVDLAGSERVSKSGATGEQLKEAQSINTSLSALGDVISALTKGSNHIPYRNHPLTMLMSDSLGGSAKTLMLVCCSPADYNRSESSSALDFARRCKNVTNDVRGGAAPQASQIRALRSELARMKKERGTASRKIVGAKRPGQC